MEDLQGTLFSLDIPLIYIIQYSAIVHQLDRCKEPQIPAVKTNGISNLLLRRNILSSRIYGYRTEPPWSPQIHVGCYNPLNRNVRVSMERFSKYTKIS